MTNVEEDVKVFRLLGSDKRYNILKELKENNEEYSTDFIEALQMNPNTLNFHLGKLQDGGLVNRGLEEKDLRYSKYFLTNKGKKVVDNFIEY